MPKVTVGITTFSAAHTIETAIKSALEQTHSDIEIVIVDDCSTDGTQTTLAELQKKHPQLRVIEHHTNQGVAAARNNIINAATGDFIAFFDDDDTSDRTRIEKQLEAIVDLERLVGTQILSVCHTARWQIYPDGARVYCATQIGVPIPNGLSVALRILIGKPIPGCTHGAMATCSQMARTNTYKQLGGFDANLRRGEDTDFNIRLALAGGYFIGVAEPLVNQAMTLRQDKSWSSEHDFAMQILRKHIAVVTAAGFAGFAEAWANMKLAFLQGRHASFLSQIIKIMCRYPRQTTQRIIWVLPNIGDNLKIGRFRRSLNCL